MNRVVLVGRLTRDPDLRYTPKGDAVANFNMAVQRPFTNQQGNRDADFINCVVWRRQAENLANYMKKGNLIGVDGRIQSRSYEGQDGKTVYVTEVMAESIQFLEPRNSNQPSGSGSGQGSQPKEQGSPSFNQGGQNQDFQPNQNQNQNDDPFKNSGEPIDISDDDLPF